MMPCTTPREAVKRWWEQDQERREAIANGMLTLLEGITGDSDGAATLDVASKLLTDYHLLLFDTPPQRHVLAHAIGQLGVEGRILNQLVRA